MNKSKVACLLVSLIISLALCGALSIQAVAAAQKIEVDCNYPILPGPANALFQFNVELMYSGGAEPLYFVLSTEGPQGWTVGIWESAYTQKDIGGVRLTPGVKATVVVYAGAPYWLEPEPGDYTITVQAASGEIVDSIDLTARITGNYMFYAETEDGNLNIEVTAGRENYLPIIVTNMGTHTLTQITFRSTQPKSIAGEAWSITFSPTTITDLKPEEEQKVQVAIKPPSKTIAGDYMITLTFTSDPLTQTAPPELEIRVTVVSSTLWGWIGAGIVIAVGVGLYFAIRRLGRR